MAWDWSKESKDEDAEYYVNDDLVPEDGKLQSRSEKHSYERM